MEPGRMLNWIKIQAQAGESLVRWADPRTLWQFLVFVYHSFEYHKGIENAKSLTYTSLFSVVPLLTVTVMILSAFPSFQVFGSQLQDMVFERLIPASSREIQDYIESFTSQARRLTWVGAVMLMVTSYLMLVNIERSFNYIWGVGEVRQGLYSFLLYWSVLSLGPLLLGLGFAISSYVTSLTLVEALTEVTSFAGVNSLLLNLFPLVLSSLGFTLLYVAVPNCGVRLRHALVGGIVVALAFIVVKKIFTWFIAQASFEFIYGTFAAIPILLIWIYVCWVVILVGANLVRCIPLFQAQRAADSEAEVHPTLLMLALLHQFWLKHQRGEALQLEELGQARWPFRGIELEEFLELLSRHKVIYAGSQSDYLLARDLRTLPLHEVLGWLPWPAPAEADLQRPLPPALREHLPLFASLYRHFVAVEQASKTEFADTVDAFFRRPGEGMKTGGGKPVNLVNQLP